MQIVCHKCGTKNRLDANAIGRTDKAVQCGRCQAPLLNGESVALTDSNFHVYIGATEVPLVVDFWAPWCGPCRMMAPQFAQAAKEMPGVIFAKLNTQDHPNAAAAYDIRGIPTMVLYEKGKELARTSGTMPARQIQVWIKQSLPTK